MDSFPSEIIEITDDMTERDQQAARTYNFLNSLSPALQTQVLVFMMTKLIPRFLPDDPELSENLIGLVKQKPFLVQAKNIIEFSGISGFIETTNEVMDSGDIDRIISFLAGTLYEEEVEESLSIEEYIEEEEPPAPKTAKEVAAQLRNL